MNRWAQLAFLVLALVLVGGNLGLRVRDCRGARAAQVQRLLEPEPISGVMPDISLLRPDGQRWTGRETRGRVALINLWATWCEPCLQELPHLARLAQQLDGRLELWLVSVDGSWPQVLALADELAGRGPGWAPSAALLRGELPGVHLALDPEERLARTLGTSRYPETYLVGADGRLRRKFVGPKAWSHPQVLDTLAALALEP